MESTDLPALVMRRSEIAGGTVGALGAMSDSAFDPAEYLAETGRAEPPASGERPVSRLSALDRALETFDVDFRASGEEDDDLILGLARRTEKALRLSLATAIDFAQDGFLG
jgi:hypothetical protein